jgi:hypothetical protein
MRFFIALVVFTVGVGCYATAALLFDRRRILRAWQANRRVRAAGGADLETPVNIAPLYLTIAGCLVFGTLLMFGSCAGLILW